MTLNLIRWWYQTHEQTIPFSMILWRHCIHDKTKEKPNPFGYYKKQLVKNSPPSFHMEKKCGVWCFIVAKLKYYLVLRHYIISNNKKIQEDKLRRWKENTHVAMCIPNYSSKGLGACKIGIHQMINKLQDGMRKHDISCSCFMCYSHLWGDMLLPMFLSKAKNHL